MVYGIINIYIYIYIYNIYKIYLFLYRASGPFGVSSETYMSQTAKQKRGLLKFHHPLFKSFFENFIWYIK